MANRSHKVLAGQGSVVEDRTIRLDSRRSCILVLDMGLVRQAKKRRSQAQATGLQLGCHMDHRANMD